MSIKPIHLLPHLHSWWQIGYRSVRMVLHGIAEGPIDKVIQVKVYEVFSA